MLSVKRKCSSCCQYQSVESRSRLRKLPSASSPAGRFGKESSTSAGLISPSSVAVRSPVCAWRQDDVEDDWCEGGRLRRVPASTGKNDVTASCDQTPLREVPRASAHRTPANVSAERIPEGQFLEWGLTRTQGEPGMPCDHQLLVGSDYPHRGSAVWRTDARPGAGVRCF